jgi:tripartite-type tricarboxylate transporter receptor subunit TctC
MRYLLTCDEGIMKRRLLWMLLCFASCLVALSQARADEYPNRNVRVVVPFSAGGAIDVIARMMARHLGDKLGQQFYVENRPGASGNIGSDLVSKAPADGFTLLISASTLIVNPVVAAEPAPFDPLKDFSYITLLARGPLLFIVHPSVGNSVPEFVAKAKAQPDKYNLATGGLGGAPHMAAEYFKIQAGLTIPVVLYRGTGPAFTDLIGGHISGMLDPLPTSLPLTQSGKTKAIAISSLKRNALASDVPTLDEVGYPGFEFYTWYGLWAPPNLPQAVADRLAAAVREIGGLAEVTQWFQSQGLEFSGLEGSAFLHYSQADQAKYQDIVKRAKIERR